MLNIKIRYTPVLHIRDAIMLIWEKYPCYISLECHANYIFWSSRINDNAFFTSLYFLYNLTIRLARFKSIYKELSIRSLWKAHVLYIKKAHSLNFNASYTYIKYIIHERRYILEKCQNSIQWSRLYGLWLPVTSTYRGLQKRLFLFHAEISSWEFSDFIPKKIREEIGKIGLGF